MHSCLYVEKCNVNPNFYAFLMNIGMGCRVVEFNYRNVLL